MPEIRHNKSQLRGELRRRRQALNERQQAAAASALSGYASQLPQWPRAKRVALYQSADGEIDTAAICEYCRQQDKHLFLPVIRPDNTLDFARWEAEVALVNNRYNIPEPPASAELCHPSRLDIIFMPLVGWDRRGGRLGMGGGFYDKSLAGIAGPTLVGLAHSIQEVEQIPREGWDISLDFIATDSALHECKAAQGR